MADGAFSVGRPIYDIFAIAKPHRSLVASDVVIEPFVNGYTANSGALGAATMLSLSSYSERTIRFDLRDAPVGVDVGQGSFKVFPAYRSGYRLEVDSDYHLTALGTMPDVDGEPVSLVSGTATELAHPDRAGLTIFTNRQRRFGAVGLAPGKCRLQMLDVKNSTFVIVVPANADGIVRLSEVRAEKAVKMVAKSLIAAATALALWAIPPHVAAQTTQCGIRGSTSASPVLYDPFNPTGIANTDITLTLTRVNNSGGGGTRIVNFYLQPNQRSAPRSTTRRSYRPR